MPLIFGLLRLRPRPAAAGTSIGLRALREAVCFIGASPVVRAVLGLVVAHSLLATGFIVLAPAVADRLAAGPEGVGFLVSGAACGSLLAGVVLARRGSRPAGRSTLLGAGACSGMGQLGVTLAPDLPVAIVAMGLAGFGMVAYTAISNATVQAVTPDSLRGRIMGFYALSVSGLIPLAAAGVGTVAEFAGLTIALCGTAAVWLLIIVAGSIMARHQQRQFERSGV